VYITAKNLFKNIVYFLTNVYFSSDYKIELLNISKVRNKYLNKIDTNNKNRLFWRTICQYEAQTFSRDKKQIILSNFIALVCLPAFIFFLRPGHRGKKINCDYLKIDFYGAYQVPEQIRNITLEIKLNKRYLYFSDLYFVAKYFFTNKTFYPELILKFLIWLSLVRPIIQLYQPKYLLQYCEYSPHSSLRKLFLNERGILLANVSHGEEYISCRSAFSSFDKYFSWLITPKKIHDDMHIEYDDREEFNPCYGLSSAPELNADLVTIGILWPVITEPDLNEFTTNINELHLHFNISVRPHPNPLNRNNFNKYQNKIKCNISNPVSENVNDFIDRNSLIVGYSSGLLVLSELRGRKVLYIEDGYLNSLREYHDYYKKVDSTTILNLVKKIKSMVIPPTG
jgi:hypothetical protein